MLKKSNRSVAFEDTELDWCLQELPRDPSWATVFAVATVFAAAACLLLGYVATENPLQGLWLLPLLVPVAYVVTTRCFLGEETDHYHHRGGLRWNH